MTVTLLLRTCVSPLPKRLVTSLVAQILPERNLPEERREAVHRRRDTRQRSASPSLRERLLHAADRLLEGFDVSGAPLARPGVVVDGDQPDQVAFAHEGS